MAGFSDTLEALHCLLNCKKSLFGQLHCTFKHLVILTSISKYARRNKINSFAILSWLVAKNFNPPSKHAVVVYLKCASDGWSRVTISFIFLSFLLDLSSRIPLMLELARVFWRWVSKILTNFRFGSDCKGLQSFRVARPFFSRPPPEPVPPVGVPSSRIHPLTCSTLMALQNVRGSPTSTGWPCSPTIGHLARVRPCNCTGSCIIYLTVYNLRPVSCVANCPTRCHLVSLWTG